MNSSSRVCKFDGHDIVASRIGFLASKLAVMDRPSDSYRELKNLGNHDLQMLRDAMNVTWVARSVEGIGDHSKNICEYVIYMVEGRDIRHTDIVESAIDSPD